MAKINEFMCYRLDLFTKSIYLRWFYKSINPPEVYWHIKTCTTGTAQMTLTLGPDTLSIAVPLVLYTWEPTLFTWPWPLVHLDAYRPTTVSLNPASWLTSVPSLWVWSPGPPRPRGLLPVGVSSSLCHRGTNLFSFYCRVTKLQWLTYGRNLYLETYSAPYVNSLFSYSPNPKALYFIVLLT